MKSPFKFLDSYTKDDRAIFFGRDREIEELYQRVFDSKLLLIYGVSGTGKSSLIHCGLANKFQDTDWLPLVVRRGGNIIESMSSAIRGVSITEQQNRFSSPGDFKKGVRSLYLDHYKPVFFIFDQFEELFIFGDREERRSFIHIVKSLTESDLQCRMIFVMREEYMAGITEFEKYIPTIFSNRVRIEKMSHRNALEAIKEPCKVFNINLEEGFAESLLEKLSPGETDVELTYLQVFLDKIFRLATNNSPFEGGQGDVFPTQKSQGESLTPTPTSTLIFTLSLLSRTGNVSDLLGSFLDDQISMMEDQDTALALLKSFVSVKGTKQPMTPEEAREYALTLGRDIKENVIRDMIQTFVNLRILCEKDQHDRYELRHDALAEKIYEKFTLADKELLEVRKYIENAYYTYERRGIMLNKQDLDYLSAYEKKIKLPPQLSDFVNASHARISKQKRTLTNITRISAVIFILIVAALGRKFVRSQNNMKQKELIGRYLLQSEYDPAEGLFNTLTLWEKYNTSSILKRIIYSNFQKLISVSSDTSDVIHKLRDQYKPLILESPVRWADINEERNIIYGCLKNNKLFTFNLIDKVCHSFDPGDSILSVKISVKDSLIAAVFCDGRAALFSFSGDKRFDFETTPNGLQDKRLVCFFPPCEMQMAVLNGKTVRIYDRYGKTVSEMEGHSDRINALDISPDGKFICTVSNDRSGLIWRLNEAAGRFTVFDTLTGHKGIIWSCEFNKTGKYILTASADSTVRIWNLYGEQINPWMAYGINYSGESRYRQNRDEYDEDRVNPELSAYYGKNCNASFSPDEMSVIVTGYVSETDKTVKDNRTGYRQVLFHDNRFSQYAKLYYNPFVGLARDDREEYKPEGFNAIDVSAPGDISAVSLQGKNEIYMLGPEGMILCRFEGGSAFFSADGSKLFIINQDKFSTFPIEIEDIISILEKHKIDSSGLKQKHIFTVL